MEQELRRQEEERGVEEEKRAIAEETTHGDAEQKAAKPEKELPMKKRNSKPKEQMTPKTKNASAVKPVAMAKDVKTKITSTAEDEDTGTPKKLKADDEVESDATPVKRSTTPVKRTTTPKKPTAAKSPKMSPSGGNGCEIAVPEGWRRVATQRMQGQSAGKFDVYYWR